MSTPRNPMALKSSDVRIGMPVTRDGEKWEVVSPHPDSGKFWLHRWVDGKYETTFAHIRDLEGRRGAQG